MGIFFPVLNSMTAFRAFDRLLGNEAPFGGPVFAMRPSRSAGGGRARPSSSIHRVQCLQEREQGSAAES